MKSTLAIDPGKTTGWALYDPGSDSVASGVARFNKHPHIKDTHLRFGHDLLDFWQWLNLMVSKYKVDQLKTEQWINWEGKAKKKKKIVDVDGNEKEVDVPIQTSAATIQWFYGIHNDIKKCAAFNAITYECVSVHTWRNTFLSLVPIKAEFVKDGQFSKGKVKLKGDEWKKATVAQCKAMGYEVKDHNEADAIGILEYFLNRDNAEWGMKRMELFRNAN